MTMDMDGCRSVWIEQQAARDSPAWELVDDRYLRPMHVQHFYSRISIPRPARPLICLQAVGSAQYSLTHVVGIADTAEVPGVRVRVLCTVRVLDAEKMPHNLLLVIRHRRHVSLCTPDRKGGPTARSAPRVDHAATQMLRASVRVALKSG